MSFLFLSEIKYILYKLKKLNEKKNEMNIRCQVIVKMKYIMKLYINENC